MHMRADNPELDDLQTIEAHGFTHTLYQVTIPDTSEALEYYGDTNKERWIPTGPISYYEIYRQDGKYIGRVSKSIRCERV